MLELDVGFGSWVWKLLLDVEGGKLKDYKYSSEATLKLHAEIHEGNQMGGRQRWRPR